MRLTEEYVAGLETELDKLKERLSWFERQVFGQKSEQTVIINQNQSELFANQENLQSPQEPVLKEKITYERKKKRTQKPRQQLPENLPRTYITYDLPQGEQACPECGETMAIVDEKVHEELKLIPARFEVIVHKRVKRACKHHAEVGVRTAPMVPRFCEKSNIGPTVVAQALADKYVNHLPYERQHQAFARYGYDIPKATLQDLIKVPEALFKGLFDILSNQLVANDIIYSDDTKIPVRDKKKKGKHHRGYIWGYGDGEKLIIFDYREGRSQDGPGNFLENFKGFLHIDGYAGYNKVISNGVIAVHCWAHARRKFVDAFLTGENERPLVLINRIFQIERAIRSRSERLKLEQKETLELTKSIRMSLTKELIDKLYTWCRAKAPFIASGSNLAKAIGYLVNQREGLLTFLSDGRLCAHNNFSERQLRSCVLGRKNWLHAGNHDAARRACYLYSLVGTCKLIGADPVAYIHWLLESWTQNKQTDLKGLTPTVYKSLNIKV